MDLNKTARKPIEVLLTDEENFGNADITENHTNILNEPPDGGIRAISVMIASFLTNGLLFGVINSYSLIHNELQRELQNQGVSNSESKSALVGSLAMGMLFFMSPLSGILTQLMGLRCTAVVGGSIATASLVISSFLTKNIDGLYFTFGILYGLGASLAYTPSLAILGHYFKKYLGIVNGVVCVGSSIFTVIMPFIMDFMLDNYGLDWLFRVLAIFTLGISLCGLLFTPISVVNVERESHKLNFKSIIRIIADVDIWKIRKYKYWALSMPVALFGYFVPYVHLRKFMETTFADLSKNKFNIPLQCIAITSGIGRLLFGFLGDKKQIDRIFLQQISFYVIGTLTIMLPFVHIFEVLVIVTLGMGLFDGAFIALIGPIAFELCGEAHVAQAIGCMLGMAAIPLSVGPPFAGYLIESYNSYKLPFVLAGISPLIGATLMFAVRIHGTNKRSNTNRSNGHIYADANGRHDVNIKEQSTL